MLNQEDIFARHISS